ncbi:hypothetical protein BRD13_03810 [Halobacteriales archaeon SW_5_70_135]|nr:MAG: hypothetical protein BRD13_03810 [Halobacteriales archaeon SW_5_70_135]
MAGAGRRRRGPSTYHAPGRGAAGRRRATALRATGDEHPVVSLHEHAFRFPADTGDLREYVREGRCYTAYEALAASNLDAVFDMYLDGLSGVRTERGRSRRATTWSTT